jgi:hypothetical protein
MTLSETEINQRFSAVKEHGEEVASAFKNFVKALDAAIPAGVAKTKLVNSLEEASGWAHHALAAAETEAKNLAHQRAKSGEKPADPAVTPAQSALQPTVPTTPVEQTTPPVDPTPAAPTAPVTPPPA